MSVGSRRWLRVISSLAVVSAGAMTPLVAGGATAVAAPPSLCAPPADTVAPQVTSLTFSTHSVDLTTGPRTVRVTAHAIDTSGGGVASGIKRLLADVSGPRGFAQTRLSLASGTTADGVWTGTLRIPRDARAGTWNLRAVGVTDHDRNTQFYDREGRSPAFPTDVRLQPNFDQTITVTGAVPTPPPPTTVKPGRLSGFTLSPTSVNTTHASKRVGVRADFAGPRPARVFLELFGGRGVGFAKAHGDARAAVDSADAGRPFFQHIRLKRTAGNHWSGHVTLHRWLGNGAAQPELTVEYGSNVKPNFKRYDGDNLKARHFSHVVHITSGIDRDKPTLRTLSVTPSPVDTTSGAQQATVTATAHDATSGVGRIQVELFNRSGAGERSSFKTVTLRQQGNDWVGHTSFQECVPSGAWEVRVFLADKADNTANYSAKKLAAAGLPGHVTVVSTPGDSIEPAVTDATASAAHDTVTLDFSEGVKNVTGSTLTVYARNPAATRFHSPLTVSSITCFNGTGSVSCTGSGGLATSAQLDVSDIGAGQPYQVFANLNSVTSQLTDGTGNPLDWSYQAADVTGS
jgi:hypothetical protein